LDPIKKAILSVYDKTGLDKLAKELKNFNISMISSGGTHKYLEDEGIKAEMVEQLTGYPHILDGRVKTLHPVIFGGILARHTEAHQADLKAHHIEGIDLVVVNLYPFEQTIAKPGCTLDQAIEQIDIGGPSLIRAAAKNYQYVTVIISPDDYDAFLEELHTNHGCTSEQFRLACARKAFQHVARYNTIISEYLGDHLPKDTGYPLEFTCQGKQVQQLRYGENPHQTAAFYSFSAQSPLGNYKQLHGKELSYNNILDLDSALKLTLEFEEPAIVILKHNNPCGAATGQDIVQVYKNALAIDPLSAFGGIVGFSTPVTAGVAQLMSEHFFECILAPEYESEALAILKKKKNIRLLTYDKDRTCLNFLQIRTVTGGLLVQAEDNLRLNIRQAEIATKRKPTEEEWRSLEFAWKIVKHVRSNAIVFAADNQLIGVGAGQMSRVDSTDLAVQKAKNAGLSLAGTVVASDAFFPFKDGIESLAEAGATAVVQPGGSIRDKEVIDAADHYKLAMIFTGKRHFKH
jgi:phosphoribosylaminoimidazolecarboxamide formyltransferase/IMP cyclohydrolase